MDRYMKINNLKYLFIVLLVLLIGAFTIGCTSESASPTPLELPTLIPTDTDIPPTPTITSTVEPTETLVPSPTSYTCLTASQLKEIVTEENPKIITYFKDTTASDNFDKRWTNQVGNNLVYGLAFSTSTSGCVTDVQSFSAFMVGNEDIQNAIKIIYLPLAISQSGEEMRGWVQNKIDTCIENEKSNTYASRGSNQNIHKLDCIFERGQAGFSLIVTLE
jgi:hypothetical protein